MMIGQDHEECGRMPAPVYVQDVSQACGLNYSQGNKNLQYVGNNAKARGTHRGSAPISRNGRKCLNNGVMNICDRSIKPGSSRQFPLNLGSILEELISRTEMNNLGSS